MKAKRKSNHSDIARSLLELEKLFGKKPPPTKDNTLREQGAVVKLLTRQLIRGGAK